MYLKHEQAQNTLTSILKTQQLENTGDLFKLVRTAMEFVEQFGGMSGEQKKTVVKNTLTTFIQDSDIDDTMKFLLIGTIDPIIQTVIQVTKKEWFVNFRKKRVIAAVFPRFLIHGV